jgi:hypothetical protein
MPVTGAGDHDTSAVAADELEELVASWRRHLRAQRMSPATISTYTVAVRQLAAYLRTQGMPMAPPPMTTVAIPGGRRALATRRLLALEVTGIGSRSSRVASASV